MIAAAAAAMVGGAFAVQVADYRSTVKYVDMTKWTRPVGDTHITPFVKVVKITTLRGYVVYSDCACNEGMGKQVINPAFLVVKSFAQTDNDPKILPADLLIKVIDNSCGMREKSDEIGAEGYLFAGAGKGSHEVVQSAVYGVAPWMFNKGYQFGSATRGTRFLFGKYNDVQGNSFYDAWLDHAGFGSAWYNEEEAGCAEGTYGTCLKKLMGYLIGGSYLCHPNGFPFVTEIRDQDGIVVETIPVYEWFPCHEWLGTTDVVAGYWGMKRIVAETSKIGKEDGAIYTALTTNEEEDPEAVGPIADTLGQVKACVAKMTNGKRSNLAFIDHVNTVTKLTKGFEYEAE